MKIAIFGLGYVGLTTAGCLLREGHSIVGIDPNETKCRLIMQGESPIFEPGLVELLALGLRDRRLDVQPRLAHELDDCDLAIVCVGTPSLADGSHNMAYIAEVSRQIARACSTRRRRLTVAYRSTVRPGTMEELVAPLFRAQAGGAGEHIELVYNPEFLRESSAIEDFFHPPKIVIGTVDGRLSETMAAINRGIEAPTFVTRYREAEITKFVDNSFHALKVAFANEIGRVCTQLGISAREVHEIFVSDRKLNISPRYFRPGGAFGGSCLPKDVRALSYLSEEVGAYTFVVDSLLKSNEAHKRFIVERATRGLAPGARILMVGLAFKADSDDLRESPNVDLARKLLQAGFKLSIFDPAVKPSSMLGANLGYAYSHLPLIEQLLVSREQVEATGYDLVIDANGRASQLDLQGARVFDANALA